MYKVYKGLTVLFVVICLVVAAVLLWTAETIFGGLVWALIWALGASFAFCVILGIVESRKMKLLENCRPRDFVDHTEKVFPTVKPKDSRNTYCINLYAGYADLGNYPKALEYLEEMDTNFPENYTGKLQEHAWHYNRCDYCLEIGDWKRAEAELEAAENVLASEKIYNVMKNSLFRMNQAQRYALNMVRGNYDGAETFFTNYLAVEKTLRGKVYAKFNLAKIYLHFGETEKARQAAMYVIQSGGQTCYVEKAKDWLLEMQG